MSFAMPVPSSRTSMIGPSSVDPLHLMLGAACGDWAVCLYLNLADAARLKTDLDRLLTDHTARG
jgi:hypothetical protein